jgi:hypothetical protein
MAKAGKRARHVPPASEVRLGVRAYLTDCLAYRLVPNAETAKRVVWCGGGDQEENRAGYALVQRLYEQELPAVRAAWQELRALDDRKRRKEGAHDGTGLAAGGGGRGGSSVHGPAGKRARVAHREA